jgi:pyridoxal phosphate enzyme (YggS family)
MSEIRERIDRVRGQIADAAARAGRDPSAITLIGVSKTRPAEDVAEAVAAGLEQIGENRVQEAAEKVERVRALLGRDPTWHLIGTLQRNKARQALELFGLIQSVDTVRLAEALSARAEGRRVPILFEVYLGDDAARPGFRPADIDTALTAMHVLSGLEVRGLMTVAPLGLTEDQTRQAFRQLRELRDELSLRHTDLSLDQLSMGMSEDFALAIEEGATMIRFGRAIFGERLFMGFDEMARFFLYFVQTLIYILNFAIIVRALMSWFNPSAENPIVRFVIEITEPVLAPLRRIVPRIGMMDITPIVAILLMNVILQVLESTLR